MKIFVAQFAVISAHGNCLVNTSGFIAISPGCYSRIPPLSGLVLKQFIDVSSGVIDADYRGELGVVLFNFGDTDFRINMCEQIARSFLKGLQLLHFWKWTIWRTLIDKFGIWFNRC